MFILYIFNVLFSFLFISKKIFFVQIIVIPLQSICSRILIIKKYIDMKKSVLFLVLLLGLISCKEGPNVEYVKAKEVYITTEDTLLLRHLHQPFLPPGCPGFSDEGLKQ